MNKDNNQNNDLGGFQLPPIMRNPVGKWLLPVLALAAVPTLLQMPNSADGANKNMYLICEIDDQNNVLEPNKANMICQSIAADLDMDLVPRASVSRNASEDGTNIIALTLKTISPSAAEYELQVAKLNGGRPLDWRKESNSRIEVMDADLNKALAAQLVNSLRPLVDELKK